MVPDRFSERAEAGPGELPDESLVEVREPGVGEVVAQVVKIRPGSVSTYGLPGGGRVRERLVADGDPQPVQNPAVAGNRAGRAGREALRSTVGHAARDPPGRQEPPTIDCGELLAVPGGLVRR